MSNTGSNSASKDPESMQPMEFQTASVLRPPPPSNAPPPVPPVALVGGYMEKENGHSMPSLEEARTSGAIYQGGAYNRYSGKNKRVALLIALAVGLVAVVTGVTVAVVRNNSAREIASAAVRDPDGDANTTTDDDTGDDSVGGEGDAQRLQAVTQFLSRQAVSGEETFNDVNSPQYKAAQWIANEDDFDMDIPNIDDTFDEAYYFVQRYVMAVFYYALDGDQWTDTLGFLSDTTVCGWNIELNSETAPEGVDPDYWYFGVVCDAEDEVLRIFIPDNALSGVLPSELGSLVTLDHLSLYKNDIQDALPETMKNLVDLTFVNLDNNALFGDLPTWLNQWVYLEILGLGDNDFSGGLPSFEGMESLTQVALDKNELSGPIDNLKAAINLEVLFLEDNAFTGTIDDNFLSGMEELRLVDLGNNSFVGGFPAHFYLLDVVDLRNNKLDGSMAHIPTDNDGDFNLWYLSVYNNRLTGVLPTGLSDLPLEYFDVAKNQLEGELTVLDDCTEFRQLYLSQNDFVPGPLPSLSGCSELEELSVSDANRNGAIAPWIGDLSELILLDLHGNAFTGEIPTELGQLGNLEVLMLNRNKFKGGIPTELASLSDGKLFLDHNELRGDDADMALLCNSIIDSSDNDATVFSNFVVDIEAGACTCCITTCQSTDPNCNKQGDPERIDGVDVKGGSEEPVVYENLNIDINDE